ncbi:MAG: alpha/beta hydrolase [Pseudomonadota bacterium]|nr:alpha/beta hydrolase [Pseudomonadota bacterium]
MSEVAGTWVFLRGLVRQQKHWERFPQLFQEAFPRTRVEPLDLPGNGTLCDRSSPLSVGEMMESARSQLQRKGVSAPLNLLAISLGGMVAIEWLHRHGREVRSAVIINSSLRNVGNPLERLRPQNYPAILKALVTNNSAEEREQLILDISSNLYPHKRELAAKWATYAHTHPTSSRNTIRQMVAAARYRAPQHRPHDRVLLLSSAHDRLVNPVCSQRLAEKWGWPLVTHPRAGHDLPLDDGPWIIQQIQRWQRGELTS